MLRSNESSGLEDQKDEPMTGRRERYNQVPLAPPAPGVSLTATPTLPSWCLRSILSFTAPGYAGSPALGGEVQQGSVGGISERNRAPHAGSQLTEFQDIEVQSSGGGQQLPRSTPSAAVLSSTLLPPSPQRV